METITLETVLKTLTNVNDVRVGKRTPKPYLIISCNAYSQLQFIASTLNEYRLSVTDKYSYLGYIKYANIIYNLRHTDLEGHLWLGLLLNRYGEKADSFQVWFLSNNFTDAAQIKLVKWRVRNKLGFSERVCFNGKECDIQHHYLHYPEPHEIGFEYNLLFNFERVKI